MRTRNLQFIIAVYATSFVYFQDGRGLNWLFVVLVSIAASLSLLSKVSVKLIIAFLACISLWVSSIFVDGIRLTSLVLSSALIMSSITVHRLICAPGIDWNKVNDFVGTLINLYFVVLITQQFGSLIGVQGLNSSTSAIELYKYNSLSSEASIAARSCFLLFTLKNYLSRKPVGLKPWVVYGYIMLSSGSALGVFLFVISSLLYMNKRLRLFFSLGFFAIIFQAFTWSTEIQRLLAVISSLGQGELDAILAADHSAAIRIVPLIIFLRELFTNPVLIGYGIDSSSDLLKTYVSGLPSDYTAGGLFTIAYEYGLIAFTGVILYLGIYLRGFISTPIIILLWFLFVPISGLNTQMLWFALIVIEIVKRKRLYA